MIVSWTVQYKKMCNDIPPQVYKTLEELMDEDVGNFDIVHNRNKKGEGYTGEIIFITLKNKKTNKEINVIVKQALKEQSIRDSMPIRNIFMNEINFYTKIWARLDEFQQQIPKEYRFQKIPKCFASSSNDKSEYLVLENLKFQNFQTHEKKLPLDKEHYELILREYGKFHGISMAFKALHPEEYADLTKELVNIYSVMTREGFFEKAIKYSYDVSAESLQPGVDDTVIEKLQPYLKNSRDIFLDSVKGKTKYTALCHGDCWSNNMMFKYDDSKRLTDVRFFDFQLVSDASPCCDLSYCIYSGASKEILQDLDYYLQIYHDSLSRTIKEFGCDPEEIFPLHALKTDWKTFCKLGFTMSLMVWKVKYTYEEDLKDYRDVPEDEKEKILQSAYDQDAFRKSVRELFYHLYESDFL